MVEEFKSSNNDWDKENQVQVLPKKISQLKSFGLKNDNILLSPIYQIEEDDEEETEFQEDQYNLFTSNQKMKLIDYLNIFSDLAIASISDNIVTYEKEIQYEGELKDNMKQGFGILYKRNPDGSQLTIYEGQFEKDQFNGRGKLTNIYTQSNFEGFINYNNLNQLSKHAWLYYQGEFIDGSFEGFGVLLLKNKQKLHAQFRKAIVYGNATVFNAESNEIIFSGEYESNILLFKNM